MSRRLSVAALLLVAGCLQNHAVECPDGSLCAQYTECVPATAPADGFVCVDPDDPPPPRCGDGHVDDGETCDDGNTDDGDHCAADCLSDLSCGNRFIDVNAGETCDDGNGFSHDGCDGDCRLEVATWDRVDVQPPRFDEYAAMAYDSRRERLVMFGGHHELAFGELPVAETWELDPRGNWSLIPTTTAPSARSHSQMAFDAKRGVVVLFGGTKELTAGESLLAEVTELDDTWTWDGTDWTPLTPTTRPPIRGDAAMAYDPVSGLVVLHGGKAQTMPESVTGSTSLVVVQRDDTFEWDGTNWQNVTAVATPDARADFGMVYAPAFGGIVAIGGSAGGMPTEELMKPRLYVHGHAWTELATASVPPSPSIATRIAYDTRADDIILLGSDLAASDLTLATWHFTAAREWRRQTGDFEPTNRIGRAMAAANDGSVILVGGEPQWSRWHTGMWTALERDPGPSTVQDIAFDRRARRAFVLADSQVFVLAARGWSVVAPAATSAANPPDTSAIVYDEATRQLLAVSSGRTALGTVGDREVAWSDGAPIPTAPFGVALAYDGAGSRVVAFGGAARRDGLVEILPFSNVTYAWTGTAWETLATPVSPPPRVRASLGFDEVRGQTVMFGGTVVDREVDETWMLVGDTWTLLAPAHRPSPRRNAKLVWNLARQRLTLVGGETGDSPLVDAWEWDGTDWTKVAPTNTPVATSDSYAVTAPDGSGVMLVQSTRFGAPHLPVPRLRWQSARPDETCTAQDTDHDGKKGCADVECWNLCTPACRPGDACEPDDATSVCETSAATCQLCPSACDLCGDFVCDGSESHATCAADCP